MTGDEHKHKLPTVLISYANLLQNAQLKTGGEEPFLDYDEAEDKAEEYRKAWAEKNDLVLNGMQECLGLTFSMPVIDVALAPWTYGAAVSFPLIVDMKSDPDEFVDILTHELFHQLFTENQIITSRNAPPQSRLQWDKLFGENHSSTTLVHIAVHACCKYIYLDVHKEDYRLERDIEHAKKYPDYAVAWDYVEEHGYKEIIEKLKSRYQEIAAAKK